MSDFFCEIPEEFTSDDQSMYPKVYTVGELKAQLNRLPEDLPLESWCSEGMVLVVYDQGTYGKYLSFEDIEDHENEEEWPFYVGSEFIKTRDIII
jgi:hypothetical protein